MRKLFELTFKGTDELQKLAQERLELLKKNTETAVADAVLFGVTKIANDCPVDTGRARASIAGEFADMVSVDLEGEPEEIAKGKSESVTDFSGMEGRIGSNVEYILLLEYFRERAYERKLTGKQIRYLFAKGILESDGQGGVIYKYRRKKSPRGFFRKNLPVIQAHFNRVLDRAVKATSEGRLLRSEGY